MINITDLKSKFKNNQLALILILVFLFIASIFYYIHEVGNNKIVRGIKIDGIKVSGLTKKEAIELLQKEEKKLTSDKKLSFILSDKSYTIPYMNLGYALDFEKAVNEAYDIGYKGNVISRYFKVLGTGIFHKNIKSKEKFDSEKVNLVVSNLEEKIFIPANDSELIYRDGKVKILPETYGRKLDTNKTKELIDNYLEEKKDIELPILELKPKIYAKDFDGIDTCLGEFSTNYSSSIKNRKENIALGASFFNDMLVKPQEEVSFNKTVGDITKETGFKEAGVIINGELDSGVGGGICQVSTTLYNALLKADLGILERSNHSRPIHYVPLGTDAAVVSGYKDLKFKNTLEHSVYIKSYANGEELRFAIFGNSKDKDYEVEIIPKLLSTNEPREIKRYSTKIPEGRKEVKSPGGKGYYYETYKEIIKDGKVLKREKISTSNYVAKDRVIIIGEGTSDDNKGEKTEK